MSVEEIVEKTIEESNQKLVENAKNRDQNSIYEILATARVKCYAEYDSDTILSQIRDQLNIKSDQELENKTDTKYFFGLPVVNDNKILAFKNPKNNTIHICKQDQVSNNSNKVYGWSQCGFGSAKGKSKSNALYLSDEDISDTYIERDGEIIGKICGNCQKSYE